MIPIDKFVNSEAAKIWHTVKNIQIILIIELSALGFSIVPHNIWIPLPTAVSSNNFFTAKYHT